VPAVLLIEGVELDPVRLGGVLQGVCRDVSLLDVLVIAELRAVAGVRPDNVVGLGAQRCCLLVRALLKNEYHLLGARDVVLRILVKVETRILVVDAVLFGILEMLLEHFLSLFPSHATISSDNCMLCPVARARAFEDICAMFHSQKGILCQEKEDAGKGLAHEKVQCAPT
jgi:hypothetical protein